MGGHHFSHPGQVEAREVELKAGAARLRALLAVPSPACGWVIFAHEGGNSLHGSAHRSVARALNGAGLATLSMELLTASEAAQRKKALETPLLAERLMAGAEWLGMESGAGVGCFGAGEGAAAALWAASEEGSGIESLVACAPRLDLASDRLGEVKASTLLIVGGADRRALKQVRWARKRMGASELIVVPGATRLFDAPAALRALAERSVEWFRRTVSGEAEAVEPARAGLSRETRRRLAAAASLLMLGGFLAGPKLAQAAVTASWNSGTGHLAILINADGDQVKVTVNGSGNVEVLNPSVSIPITNGPVPVGQVQSMWCDINGLNDGGAGGPAGAQLVDFSGVNTANGFVAGNFTVPGGANDTLVSDYKIGMELGDENDTAIGSAFTDYIDLAADNDLGLGGDGGDQILGTGGADTIDGQGGDDVVNGGALEDILTGSAGNDTLTGGGGSDTITDLQGNNSIGAGAEGDLVLAGPGDDTIAGGGNDDTINAGDGNNSVNGGTESDTIVAGNGNDTLDGGSEWDTLDGGGGDDSLNGGTEEDLVLGNTGNDTLNCSSGNDSLDGGEGTDRFVKDHPDGAAATAGSNMALSDTVLLYRVPATGVNESTRLLNCEIPVLNGGGNFLQLGTLAASDSVDATGWTATLGAQLSGGDGGNDTLLGTGGPDTIVVNFGQDVISPGSGVGDVLNLNIVMDASADTGTQANTIPAGVGATLVGTAADTLTFLHNAAVPLTLGWDLAGFESVAVQTAAGADTIDASAVTLAGSSTTLAGDEGADRITGSPLNDVLIGGDGNDTVNGGAGNDRYVFGTGWGVDALSDSAGSDTADFGANDDAGGLLVELGSLTVEAGANSVATSDAIENVIGGLQDDWFKVVPTASTTLFADGGGGGANRLTYDSEAAGVTSVNVLDSGNDTVPSTLRGNNGVQDVLYLNFGRVDTVFRSNARTWQVFE